MVPLARPPPPSVVGVTPKVQRGPRGPWATQSNEPGMQSVVATRGTVGSGQAGSPRYPTLDRVTARQQAKHQRTTPPTATTILQSICIHMARSNDRDLGEVLSINEMRTRNGRHALGPRTRRGIPASTTVGNPSRPGREGFPTVVRTLGGGVGNTGGA